MATKPAASQLKAGLQAVWKAAASSARPVTPGKPRPATPPPAPAGEGDDLAAFRSAVAGAQALPSDNRVILPKAPSRRMPPPREREQSPAARQRDNEAALPAHWHHEGSLPPAPRDPDSAAFARAMAGVAPLPDCNRVVLGTLPPAPRPQQSLADEQAALHESLHGQIGLQDRLEGGDEPNYLRTGVSAGTLRDLRRGRWVVQDQLDLHGLNRDDARQQLATWLAASLHHGLRCVRVIHGKGHGSPQKTSILRQLVRGWLAQRDEVLAYCQAKPQDGGEGALIVLLRAPKHLRA